MSLGVERKREIEPGLMVERVGRDLLLKFRDWAEGACLLMMSAFGEIYGGIDWRLLFVGKSGTQAIENIISGKDMQIIHDKPLRKAVKQGPRE